jgi:type 1 fimbria pilin
MRKITSLCVSVLLCATLSFASTVKAGTKTFVGNISDSMCGLKHLMPGKSDKECTLECVKAGSKYVLADVANGKVYQLSDQKKPEQFAGQKVKVTGALKGDTISVTAIEPAK